MRLGDHFEVSASILCQVLTYNDMALAGIGAAIGGIG
jgi:hypothetical protein